MNLASHFKTFPYSVKATAPTTWDINTRVYNRMIGLREVGKPFWYALVQPSSREAP